MLVGPGILRAQYLPSVYNEQQLATWPYTTGTGNLWSPLITYQLTPATTTDEIQLGYAGNTNTTLVTYEQLRPMLFEQTVGTDQRPMLFEQTVGTDQDAVRRMQALRREQVERRQRAFVRANNLLESMLTREQAEQYREEKRFYVRGSLGRRYRIDCGGGYMGNVCWVSEEGRVLGVLCAYTEGDLPPQDRWLGQKLALEADEMAWLRVANRHEGFHPREVPVGDEEVLGQLERAAAGL